MTTYLVHWSISKAFSFLTLQCLHVYFAYYLTSLATIGHNSTCYHRFIIELVESFYYSNLRLL